MIEYLNKVEELQRKYEEVNKLLGESSVFDDMERYTQLNRERAVLEPLNNKYQEYKKVLGDLEEYNEYLYSHDEELKEMADKEVPALEELKKNLEKEMILLLLPYDPVSENNAIFEIRAGTGGEEAALFSTALFRMYSKYADAKGYKCEIIDENPTELGGYKEMIFKMKGKNIFGTMKYEGGVHRVQRVPTTEASGRIHTSSCSVVVLPEITDDIEVQINPDDLRIDVYRSGGAGGQHVNKTESAVRLTHIPTGIVVICQNERSQHQNKAQAMMVLKSRLYDLQMEEKIKNLSTKRKSLIGTGNRNEKIRTYNYPQSRLTDHRIGYTSYRLNDILDGDLDELLYLLKEEDALESIKDL